MFCKVICCRPTRSTVTPRSKRHCHMRSSNWRRINAGTIGYARDDLWPALDDAKVHCGCGCGWGWVVVVVVVVVGGGGGEEGEGEGERGFVDSLGRHRAACQRSGRLRSRAARTLVLICMDAGAVVLCNVKLREINVTVQANDDRWETSLPVCLSNLGRRRHIAERHHNEWKSYSPQSCGRWGCR